MACQQRADQECNRQGPDGCFARESAYLVEPGWTRRDLVCEISGHAADRIHGLIEPFLGACVRLSDIFICHENSTLQHLSEFLVDAETGGRFRMTQNRL